MKGATMQIRDATERDIAAIRELGEAAWHDTYAALTPPGYVEDGLARWWSEAALASAIGSPEALVLVAEEGAALVGVAEMGLDAERHTATLWKLYVARERRGQGVGTALLHAAILCLPTGIATLFTEYLQANRRAAAFYAAHGFVEDHEDSETFAGVAVRYVFVRREVVPARARCCDILRHCL